MSNVTFLHRLGPGHCPFHIIGQFIVWFASFIIMTFDIDLVITINLRNEFLWSELYGNVVLEICVSPLVKITIWHYSPLLIMVIMLIKKIAQSCRLGNKAEFVPWSIGNMNQ